MVEFQGEPCAPAQYLHHILAAYNASVLALQSALVSAHVQLQVFDPRGLTTQTIVRTARVKWNVDGSSSFRLPVAFSILDQTSRPNAATTPFR